MELWAKQTLSSPSLFWCSITATITLTKSQGITEYIPLQLLMIICMNFLKYQGGRRVRKYNCGWNIYKKEKISLKKSLRPNFSASVFFSHSWKFFFNISSCWEQCCIVFSHSLSEDSHLNHSYILWIVFLWPKANKNADFTNLSRMS